MVWIGISSSKFSILRLIGTSSCPNLDVKDCRWLNRISFVWWCVFSQFSNGIRYFSQRGIPGAAINKNYWQYHRLGGWWVGGVETKIPVLRGIWHGLIRHERPHATSPIYFKRTPTRHSPRGCRQRSSGTWDEFEKGLLCFGVLNINSDLGSSARAICIKTILCISSLK